MPDLATDIAIDVAIDLASNLAGSANWLGVDGYSLLLETVAPSVLTIDTVPDPDEVDSWVDSTANYTYTPAGANKATHPYTAVNGYDGVKFLAASSAYDSAITLAHTDTYTIGMVVWVAAANGEIWGTNTSGTENVRTRVNATSKLVHVRNGATHASSASCPTGSAARLMITYDGSNSILRVEGSSEETSALAIGSFTSNSSRMGDRAGGGGSPLDGAVYCVALYGGASGVPASAALRSTIWSALGTRFGL